ncbi:MAG TPA: ABC transporter ATP-binding protein [Gemmatimonadales bacterium]|jgi:ABC-type Fe3+/spermidine/putrescine transport system ATPase subunit|nr:ABC transporter ATP-binding protein [Gemmatimonadales bacterium]
MNPLAFLELRDLTKFFGPQPAVDHVSLTIQRGEILALLGPSGSGKTTTLRLLAGFEVPDEGQVLVEGEDVIRLAPVHRRFGMVFQHYALFPHLDVGQNVAFGLESLGVKGTQLGERVAASLALVDLAGFERRRIGQLSGGQQQRVALARALAPEPRVLLLDEPLSNLDPSLRERTRREIRDLIHRVGITTVLVTHEQEEAFDLGDRIALLRNGRLEQFGTPDELYDQPATPFVAGFIGRATPIEGRVAAVEAGAVVVEVGGVRLRVHAKNGIGVGQAAQLMSRPEAFVADRPAPDRLNGEVISRRFVGASSLFTVQVEGGPTIEVAAPPQSLAVGARVGLLPSGRGLHAFPLEPR